MGKEKVIVVGAGLAGSEAAWQIASRGIDVVLYEMRPKIKTPAHITERFAELVCSNSLRANGLTNAVGILKQEMRVMNSLIIACADLHAVPAGGALAVDRDLFSQEVTNRLRNHPNIEVKVDEVRDIPENITVIATGPLTSDHLSRKLVELFGEQYFYFYDAAAPIIEKDSLNMEKVFLASRYNKGEAAYLNCPMDEEQYNLFYEALIQSETAPLKYFEKEIYFEGCMPIEVLAKRGPETLLFGPMKPVGLTDPRTGKYPYAVVQLRQDNIAGTLFNMVGFQTHLKWNEQRKVFSLIPGLEHAEFVRYGVMHCNTFINSPKLLKATYQYINNEKLFIAGQMTGVEGYVESAASGLVAGINAAFLALGKSCLTFPEETALGSMAKYITQADPNHFQPINANFGLFPSLEEKKINKQSKNEKFAIRALSKIKDFSNDFHLNFPD